MTTILWAWVAVNILVSGLNSYNANQNYRNAIQNHENARANTRNARMNVSIAEANKRTEDHLLNQQPPSGGSVF